MGGPLSRRPKLGTEAYRPDASFLCVHEGESVLSSLDGC